ncbi:hypothetical protein DFH09DRAFT_1073638 [Mycena vulgaris]|nr:hypothetical protein DFH09DRAFT_1073638 [Mycena vulgaris]
MSDSPTALRRTRQVHILEMLDDLDHKLDAVGQGSSPISQTLRDKAVGRTEGILGRLGVDLERSKPVDQGRAASQATPTGSTSNQSGTAEPANSGPLAKKPRLPATAARQNQVNKRLSNLMVFANEDPLTQCNTSSARNKGTDAKRRLQLWGGSFEGIALLGRNLAIKLLDNADCNTVGEEIKGICVHDALEEGAQMQANHQKQALQDNTESVHVQQLSEYTNMTGTGSNKKKQVFYEGAYQDLEVNRHFFTGLTKAECKQAIKGEHKESYKAWPVVFLNPFWDVSTLVSNKRSKEFPQLLKQFLETSPRTQHVQKVTEEIEIVPAIYKETVGQESCLLGHKKEKRCATQFTSWGVVASRRKKLAGHRVFLRSSSSTSVNVDHGMNREKNLGNANAGHENYCADCADREQEIGEREMALWSEGLTDCDWGWKLEWEMYLAANGAQGMRYQAKHSQQGTESIAIRIIDEGEGKWVALRAGKDCLKVIADNGETCETQIARDEEVNAPPKERCVVAELYENTQDY